jgi:hypothetical protein
MDPTDNLTNAVAAWLTAVLPRLGPEEYKAWEEMLEGRCDAGLQVRLRVGTITLVAINEAAQDEKGRYTELYREDVGPLRMVSGFGQPDTNTRQ